MSRRSQKGLSENPKDNRTILERKQAVLASVAEYGNLAGACRELKIPLFTAETWQERDEEFREALAQARRIFVAKLENEALRRAVEGVTEGIYYQGDRVDSIQKYSDGLLTFLLKANAPDKYRDLKMSIEIVTVDAIDAEIMRLRKQLEGERAKQ